MHTDDWLGEYVFEVGDLGSRESDRVYKPLWFKQEFILLLFEDKKTHSFFEVFVSIVSLTLHTSGKIIFLYCMCAWPGSISSIGISCEQLTFILYFF